jgi:hypothetical protein
MDGQGGEMSIHASIASGLGGDWGEQEMVVASGIEPLTPTMST